MIEEFIKYNEAKALKDLKCNVDSFAYYIKKFAENAPLIVANDFMFKARNQVTTSNNRLLYGQYTAPLYQQVFKWFKLEYNLYGVIFPLEDKNKENTFNYSWVIFDLTNSLNTYSDTSENGFVKEDDAKTDCLQNLIKIVNEKSNGEGKKVSIEKDA